MVALLAFVTGLLVAPADLTAPPPPQAALLFDASGRYFAAIRSPETRTPVKAQDIPDHMRNAIVAAEDERFLEHKGVDPIAVLRAAYRDLRQKRVAQGGSTITQQYVKNVYVGSDRTALRKIREAALAVRVEQRMSKDEILTAYLNAVYFGNGAYGVEAASRYYFGIAAKQLSLGQAAMLAGIVPAPSVRNPVRDLRTAREKQLDTLNRMVRLGMIDSRRASAEFRTAPTIVRSRSKELPTEAPEFTDLVLEQLKKSQDEDSLFRAGLRVTTTLDIDMQKAATAAAREVLSDPDDPDVAITVLDPRTGDVKAMHSSRYVRGGFNYATMAKRSTGSTMKPFALLPALQAGKKDTDVYPNPRCFRYAPRTKPACNYESSGGGSLTLRRATWRSSNTVYLQLAKDLGMAKVRQAALDAGVEGSLEPVGTMVIGGGVGVTPASMATAFGTIVNHGIRQERRTLLEVRVGGAPTNEVSGRVVDKADPKPKGRQVFPRPVADLTADILVGVVESGTARAARLRGQRVIGKTGTTDNNADAWFIGCTEALCVSVWMGHGKGLRPMGRVQGVGQVTGGTLPARMFKTFHDRLAQFRASTEPKVEVSRSPRPRSSRTPTPTTAPTAVRTVLPSVAPTPSRTPSRSPSPSPTRPGPLPTLSRSPSPSPRPTPS